MANCKGRIQLEDNTHLFWGRKSDRTGWVKSSDFLGWFLVEEITSSGQLKAREGIPLGQQADSSVSDGVRSSPRLDWDRDRWGHTGIKTSLCFPRAWGSGLPKPHHSTPSHPRGGIQGCASGSVLCHLVNRIGLGQRGNHHSGTRDLLGL